MISVQFKHHHHHHPD
ncbi:his operon leader peptide [Serratia ficaria]|nr:his operon leader peptide [Serratia ficaria]